MASTWRRTVVVGGLVALMSALVGCGGDRSAAVPATVRVSGDIVEAWRQGWEPYANRFWDAVDAWHAAEGSPTDMPAGGTASAARSAAPVIAATALAWSQVLPSGDLPGDVTARAAALTSALGAVTGAWARVEECGADPACVVSVLADVRMRLYELRSAEFALRPR